MSRNFFPVIMAIGVGVFTGIDYSSPDHGEMLASKRNFVSGYYTFQPTFQQLAAEKSPSVQSSNPAGASDKSTGALNAGALTIKPEADKKQ
ncbi:hypothetical protein N7523_009687 [Penicillium sp. IBT 18751x]|nr:hypothetical protein N7523_009687 [Penicillium sp. IBT 18751x]